MCVLAENDRALRAEYEAAHAEKMADYKSLQEERAEARRQKHLAFARNTAWQMVGFAEQAIQYREDTDGAKVTKALNRSTMPRCAQRMPWVSTVLGRPQYCMTHKPSDSLIHCLQIGQVRVCASRCTRSILGSTATCQHTSIVQYLQ